MDQERRTSIARGGLTLLLGGGIVGAIALSGVSVTTALIGALLGLSAALLVTGYKTDRQALLAVWFAPVVAAIVLFLFADGGSGDTLLLQAGLLAVIGVGQVLLSQLGG